MGEVDEERPIGPEMLRAVVRKYVASDVDPY
jgi:hypothetical protein